MFSDFNLPDGVRVRDLPGFGREPGEHSPECLRYNRRAARAGGDTDCICGADDPDTVHHSAACLRFNRAVDDRRDAECICGAEEEPDDEIEVPAAVVAKAKLIGYHADVLDAVIGLMGAKR